LYGGGKDTLALSLDPKAIIGIIRSHGGVNTIFELRIQGVDAKENVMIREYQIEPVVHQLIHADLVRVAMDKELTLDVAIELTGTAVGVKVGGGMLDFVTRTAEVAVFPRTSPRRSWPMSATSRSATTSARATSRFPPASSWSRMRMW
jgi:large subunit ribosomal protein L25